VRKLSLGQRMKADLAASLLHLPPVLFLDEPTVGLDVATKARLRDFLKELNRNEGTTILLTTHDMHDIEALSQRVVVIDHGKIMHDGDLTSLTVRYGARTRLVLSLTAAADVAAADLPRDRVTWSQPEPLLAVATLGEDIEVAAVLQRALGVLPVGDVKIDKPAIEQVVQELYERKTAVSAS
jgi:ABC-2 type transport system ATP-binding protein